MSAVYENARSLVKALRESDECQKMKRFGSKVKADTKLEALLSEFRLAQFEVQAVQLQGGKPSHQQQERLEQLAKKVESQGLLRDYLMAETAYSRMLVEVQQILAESFDPKVPGAVRER